MLKFPRTALQANRTLDGLRLLVGVSAGLDKSAAEDQVMVGHLGRRLRVNKPPSLGAGGAQSRAARSVSAAWRSITKGSEPPLWSVSAVIATR
jgi:hypothetical protein